MKLSSLILLVLLIVGGTAASVQWYLQAEPRVEPARALARPASLPVYTTLPMRADPARDPRVGLGPWHGVAIRDSESDRSRPAPEVTPASPCDLSGGTLSAFEPQDPL